MYKFNIENIINSFLDNILENIEFYLPKILGALIIVGIGALISIGIYKFVMYLFKKFKIIELIDKLNIDFSDTINKDEILDIEEDELKEIKEKILIKRKKSKLSDKIKINIITSKAVSYYFFLIFFRLSIIHIGIKEVEIFLGELINYLPSLFIAIVIGFFGVRFANFIHDVVFHALDFSKQKTAKIIASGAQVIILFFTLMVVLSKIGIESQITNTILIGFISMLSIAGGLAFGLGGKDIAHEILESFRK